jgi:hypothetical protein
MTGSMGWISNDCLWGSALSNGWQVYLVLNSFGKYSRKKTFDSLFYI